MVKLSDEARKLIEKYQKTEKQKEFQFDFFVDQSKYEKWEDVVIGTEGFGERTFEVNVSGREEYGQLLIEEVNFNVGKEPGLACASRTSMVSR